MEDHRIIELFWDRSEEAIPAAAGKYGPLCRQIALNLLRSESDAEECVNDTWLALWNAIPPEKPARLSTFVAKIARNLAMKRLTYRNAAKRSCVTVSYEELSECIPAERTVHEELEARELAALLDRFLDTLEPDSRNIFLRRYWFFDSTRQIARGFGVSESAVRSRLFYIRKKLKDYLLKEADIHVG